MGRVTIHARTKTLRLAMPLVFAGTLLAGEPVEMAHLCTYGSRLGIHPPRAAARKTAVTAAGESEHPYGLGFPEAVATDQRGRVWITDSATASVHVFDPVGGGYHEIRRAGPAAFVRPAGIVSDPQGRVFVADSVLANVFAFDENGEFDRALVKKSEHTLQQPTALALSGDGKTIYVLEPEKNQVVAMNREGELDGIIPLTDATRDPVSITVIDNQLYVLGGRQHRVEVFSPAGRSRGEVRWEGMPAPLALGYDSIGRRTLVANPRQMVVEIFDADGQNVGAFGHVGDGVDEHRRISAIHVDARGFVYLVDSHQGKILVFRPVEESPAPATDSAEVTGRRTLLRQGRSE